MNVKGNHACARPGAQKWAYESVNFLIKMNLIQEKWTENIRIPEYPLGPNQKSPNLAWKFSSLTPLVDFPTFGWVNFAWAADDSVRPLFPLMKFAQGVYTRKYQGSSYLTFASSHCLQRTSQNTCVSSINSVCNLSMFVRAEVVLVQFCTLALVICLLKSISRKLIGSIVSECYYAFFMGCKARTKTCSIVYHISSFVIESLWMVF